MGLLDAATAPLRHVLGVVAHEVAASQPLDDLQRIENHVVSAVEAISAATEQVSAHIDAVKDASVQLEAHVEVVERLARTLTPLTTAMAQLAAQMPALVETVNSLSAKLDIVAEVLEPLARAEHDVTKLGHLFSHHKVTPPSDA